LPWKTQMRPRSRFLGLFAPLIRPSCPLRRHVRLSAAAD
jgi:hypothetical protein